MAPAEKPSRKEGAAAELRRSFDCISMTTFLATFVVTGKHSAQHNEISSGSEGFG